MKEKGTLLVVGSLLALSLATVTTARAAGTLNFTGKIINESCQIANNGGDVNVDFGNVDMSALKSHEAKTAETPFTINLTGCPLAQNISISLEGTPDTNANGTSAAVLPMVVPMMARVSGMMVTMRMTKGTLRTMLTKVLTMP